ncbi:pleckstrin homology domain-containing protein 1-like [Silene latifolia]|uniref:pleckstrin homology domain-containing protein 1-like n=1 Tax=Silene latifolia TaxID=37657 RepID=UPI003D779812
MDRFLQMISPPPRRSDYNNIEFWVDPERVGWLSKQGEYLKFWRRRWFVLKQGKMVWFMNPSDVTSTAVPRGVFHVDRCQVVTSAVDDIHKDYSLKMYIDGFPTYLVAESEKEKDEWVSSIGRVIVQYSGAGIPEVDHYR